MTDHETPPHTERSPVPLLRSFRLPDEDECEFIPGDARLSEWTVAGMQPVLRRIWDTPEEDAAWANLSDDLPDHHADELAERVLATRSRMVETALRLADELSAEKTKEATL